MAAEKKWSDLSWEEKREERFKRWLNPEGIEFVSPEAEKIYKERVTRLIAAIKLEEADRVPVFLPTGNYPAYHAGYDFHTMMYDIDKMKDAWLRYMQVFGDMDTFNGPSLIPSGKIAEAMGSRVTLLPGIGLSKDSPTNQTVEAEWMTADEYDRTILDFTDYHIRVNLPRTTQLLEPFAKLPPLTAIRAEGFVGLLADPELRKTVRTLLELGEEQEKRGKELAELGKTVMSNGYPSLFGGGVMTGAAFDHFADLLRGTRGISKDMFRQPKKLHEAMEHQLQIVIELSVKNFPMTNCPVCIMPLHKGDDTFMSDAQFEEFYWPYLRRLFLAMIDEGLVPMPFAEGIFNNRLKQIADTPRSGVMWWFDQTDMAKAKEILGDVCCIVGNAPTSLVMKGEAGQVKEYCRDLIEKCAPGGGYILAGGASINTGKIENLKAMMEAAYEYGVYKK